MRTLHAQGMPATLANLSFSRGREIWKRTNVLATRAHLKRGWTLTRPSSYSAYSALLCIIVALASPRPLRADLEGLQQQLNSAYDGHDLVLRGFVKGAQLRYDHDGKLEGGGSPGDWTVDGIVRVDKMSFRRDKLEITGQRMLQVYGVAPGGAELLKGSHLRIQAELGSDVSAALVQDLMRRIFLSPEEALADHVPDYWKPFLQGKVRPSNKPLPAQPWDLDLILPSNTGQDAPLEVGKGVSAPVPRKAPDPEFTPEARAAKLGRGIVDLLIVVGVDGTVHDVVVLKPLGLGLDDAAARRVRNWTFKPAMRHGVPFPAKVVVEVSFKTLS
jgi:TonB family protein